MNFTDYLVIISLMSWLQHTLQTYPELAIFFTLAIGFYIGNLRIGKFSLGTVTAVLLTGMLIGQLNIAISPNVKSVFFMMFLFSVGYSVGPQFFRGLKKEGLPQMLFAVLMSIISLSTVWLISVLMNYGKGQAAGLLSGSHTVSAVIGVASGTIQQLDNISAADKQKMINEIPICYAVTYIFGTAGGSWLLSRVGPKILGGLNSVKEQCKTLEEKMGIGGVAKQPGMRSALATTSFNAYLVTEKSIACNKTIAELEHDFLTREHRIFIRRLRRDGIIQNITPDLKIKNGDVIAVNGRREFILPEAGLGVEVIDDELLNFPISNVTMYVTNNESAGLTLKELALQEHMRGVLIQGITRASIKMPIYIETKIEKGDQLDVVGFKDDIDRAATHVGYVEVPTQQTNIVFVALGIALGGLIGSITIRVGGAPLSLSTSGGALLFGILFGWLRSQKPAFGRIPEAAVWIMNNMGLTVFIAAVGITSGPTFIAGLKQMGLDVFLAGIVATTIPVFAGLFLGKYLFKFHPAYTLGCTAGARSSTASLKAIQETLQSELPTLGYAASYAVGVTLLIIGGIAIVLLV